MHETVPFAIFRDPRFLAHDPGDGHPEHPGRLGAIHRDLDASPPAGSVTLVPRAAGDEEVARVHEPELVAAVHESSGVELSIFDADTVAGARTAEAAFLAAGATLEGVERTLNGSARGAMALVRPPGHHAEADRAMGFCFFNNVAVAAQFAIDHFGLERVLILDPDVHHGNGTQNLFYGRRDVLYVSSHRYPFYPGTGWFDEIGAGEGTGYTVNLPLCAGLRDADLFHIYDDAVTPIVDEYEPELILVSAGFDMAATDPMGGMAVSTEGFAALYQLFASWAARHCPGRSVLALEGGYDPKALADGVRAAIEVTAGTRTAARPSGAISPRSLEIAARARATLRDHWSRLRTTS